MLTILSLCDLSGEWPRPYREAGYNVIQTDLALDGKDVRLIRADELPRVHGVLMAPPCTVFSYARNRYEPADAELLQALSVVDACVRLAIAVRQKWWVLENPVNKLRRYLGDPVWAFRHWEHGDEAEKPTGLWGDFTPPMYRPGPRTKPSTFRTSQENARPEDAITPPGFARAFFEANP